MASTNGYVLVHSYCCIALPLLEAKLKSKAILTMWPLAYGGAVIARLGSKLELGLVSGSGGLLPGLYLTRLRGAQYACGVGLRLSLRRNLGLCFEGLIPGLVAKHRFNIEALDRQLSTSLEILCRSLVEIRVSGQDFLSKGCKLLRVESRDLIPIAPKGILNQSLCEAHGLGLLGPGPL